MQATARRRVALLEASVAERIAAGEVIERPASIVKELVENSLDAGATRVWVEVRDGGQTMIKVTDDGCGMSREDAVLALSRFATSKISQWDDMEALSTLGFRGEAVPSVAAVSRLEVLTREPDAELGTRVVARGSDPPLVTEIGCAVGTTAVVTELFFNTPARKKFLKSGSAETSRIIEMLGKMALSRTDVHLRLTASSQQNEAPREVFNFPVQYGLAERLARLWNLPERAALLEVSSDRVRGVVALPPLFAATRVRQVFFVNGRLITSAALSQALAQGFSPLLPDRKFPMAALFIEVPPDEVDVNIHPTKAEVRFLNPREVFRLVKDAVAGALARQQASPADAVESVRKTAVFGAGAKAFVGGPKAPPVPVTTGRSSPTVAPRVESRPSPRQVEAAMEAVAPLPTPPPEANHPRGKSADAAPEVEEPALFPEEEVPDWVEAPAARAPQWQVLAQLDRTFIVCTHDQELWIVDQHCAHERINYERLAHLTEGPSGLASQALLFPLLLDLPPHEAEALRGMVDLFAELGYEMEPFGGDTFVVRAVPAGLSALSKTHVVQQIISEVVAEGKAEELERRRWRLRATTACRASVMAGDVLTHQEMERLLDDLHQTPHADSCPHGRPISFRLGPAELSKLFGRC